MLCLAWAATLADHLLHLPSPAMSAASQSWLFLLLEFRNQRRYAQVLFLALFAIGMVGVVLAAEPPHLFLAGWRRGASYAAFFLALTTLRDAAETSPLVRRCGQHLVAQPPGRRYAALTAGGHVFGITLSYGAIELLAAMVMRANTLEAAGGFGGHPRHPHATHAAGDLSRVLHDELLEPDQHHDGCRLHRRSRGTDAAAAADRVRRVGRHDGTRLGRGPAFRCAPANARRSAAGHDRVLDDPLAHRRR